MPIYEYRCASCGGEHEVLQKISEPLLTMCPTCQKDTLKKLVSAAGFQLKGSGWYATDFKGGSKKTENTEKTEKAEKTESKSDDKTSTPASTEPKKKAGCGSGGCGHNH